MRALFLCAGGLLALSLTGCDLPSLTGQRTAQVVPPAAPCNCAPAPAAEEHLTRLEAPATHRHRHKHYAASSHSYSQSWASEYDEADSSPSYSSDSRGYREDEEDAGEEHVSGERAEIWIDGYGRAHHGGGAVTRVAADDRERLDPWHAYKSKCGDKEPE